MLSACEFTKLALGMLLLAANVSAETIRVPEDVATIAEAIARAEDGDEVVAADGIWSGPGNYALDLAGKAITVRSANGAEQCILSLHTTGRAFRMQSGEGRDTVIQGFTVRGAPWSPNGYYAVGQGAWLSGVSPTFRECVFQECGDIYVGYAWGALGGAIRADGGAPRFERCLFDANDGMTGGAVFALGSSPEFIDCVFRNNEAFMQVWPVLKSGTVLDGNGGGGVYLADCPTARFVQCVFDGNRAFLRAGGLCLYASAGVESVVDVVGCTFVGNKGLWDFYYGVDPGVAITATAAIGGSLDVLLSHAIVYDNQRYIDALSEVGAARILTRHSDVEGGWPGTGVFDADPLLVDVDGHDYRLASGSPCIDAGATGLPPLASQADLLGHSRLLDGDFDGVLRMDPGAVEYSHVSGTLSGGTLPGDQAWLALDGTAGLTWAVLLGLPAPGPTPLVPKLGFPLATLPLGLTPVFGPGTLPSVVGFSIPAGLPPGTTWALLPVVKGPQGTGNFGAPVWITVH